MSDLKHDVIAERWAMLIATAVIRKGNIAIEVTESASAVVWMRCQFPEE